VATAFLKKQAAEDTRVCEVSGKSFDGLASSFSKTKGAIKVLMVHGVGSHTPGYSAQFQEKLAKELGLTVMSSRYKEFRITIPEFANDNLGVLRIKRLLNEDESRELLFYEYTWTEITAQEKSSLAYDNSGEYSYRRAEVNDFLKKFSNDTAPDPMIYLGDRRKHILAGFRSAFCWMISHNWEDLPEQENQICDPLNAVALKNLAEDEYSIVSHSLGSRIVMDGMHSIVDRITLEAKKSHASSKASEAIEEFKKKSIPLYMLSNQLPLLQMGHQPPKVTGQRKAYCTAEGSHYNERIVEKTTIIAFSDPNDLLSYAIPQGFAEHNLDSRLCSEVINININVTKVVDILGLGTFANPLAAHTGYDSDERVVALIAHGIGNENASPLVIERCKWIRLID